MEQRNLEDGVKNSYDFKDYLAICAIFVTGKDLGLSVILGRDVQSWKISKLGESKKVPTKCFLKMKTLSIVQNVMPVSTFTWNPQVSVLHVADQST
jgi:hypothetical protein